MTKHRTVLVVTWDDHDSYDPATVDWAYHLRMGEIDADHVDVLARVGAELRYWLGVPVGDTTPVPPDLPGWTVPTTHPTEPTPAPRPYDYGPTRPPQYTEADLANAGIVLPIPQGYLDQLYAPNKTHSTQGHSDKSTTEGSTTMDAATIRTITLALDPTCEGDLGYDVLNATNTVYTSAPGYPPGELLGSTGALLANPGTYLHRDDVAAYLEALRAELVSSGGVYETASERLAAAVTDLGSRGA